MAGLDPAIHRKTLAKMMDARVQATPKASPGTTPSWPAKRSRRRQARA
jgi:hypothetical protein